ncbi:MAG: dipeptidase [Clostridia bacterium]|nr:dipeptidase [Clostridia bacterium]
MIPNDRPAFPAADAHCDFLYGMINRGYDLSRPARRQAIRLDKLREGGVKLQFFAAWIDMEFETNPLSQCCQMIDAYCRMLEANPSLVPLTRDFDPSGEKIAAVLTVEGGEAIEASIANLRILHRLGVRAMTLTWNDANRLAYPAAGGSRKGLTKLGRDAVREMCRLGVAVDLAHLNDHGIDDVLEIATRPVFASHSNARALCASPRCLKDEHIREIARKGGVIGVNFFHKQLAEGRMATVGDVVAHIEHIASVGGVNCAALGSDFDGMGTYIEGLSTSAGMPLIANELLRLNYSEHDVKRIMFGNLYDYIIGFC